VVGEPEPARAFDGVGHRVGRRAGALALGEGGALRHLLHELSDEQLLEAHGGLVGLLVGGGAVADLARQRAVGDRREAGERAHRFTPLAISHIWSAV
jgi:hypothetical protein